MPDDPAKSILLSLGTLFGESIILYSVAKMFSNANMAQFILHLGQIRTHER
jgi:hypothetical protein